MLSQVDFPYISIYTLDEEVNVIRKMQKKDLKYVKLLIQSIPGLWHDIYTDETIARAFVSSEDLAFVYDSDGQIVGAIFAHDLGFKGFLGMLAAEQLGSNLNPN